MPDEIETPPVPPPPPPPPPPVEPPPLPEVRQQTDPESDHYGAVAVDAGNDRWGVMTPDNGGHWTNDAGVESWAVRT